MSGWTRRLWRVAARLRRGVLGRLLQRYLDDGLPNWAAAVAYHTLVSMFPLLLALTTLLGLVLHDERRLGAVVGGVVRIFPPEAADPLLATLQGTRENAGLLGLLSVVGLIYGGSALFGSLEEVLNRIYRVANRGFLQQKIMATGMLLLFAVLLLLVLAAASVAEMLTGVSRHVVADWQGWLPWLPALVDFGELAGRLASGLSLGGAFLLFLLVYWVVPNRSFTIAQLWPGAALAAVLFVAITELFPLYLVYFGHFNRYGTAFTLLLLLLAWFYFLAHIMLLGATLNAFVEDEQRAGRRRAAAPSEVQADGAPPQPVPKAPATPTP